MLGDVSFYVGKLCKLPLHKVMDFFADACSNDLFSEEDLNEFLEEQTVGYSLDEGPMGRPRWGSARIGSIADH